MSTHVGSYFRQQRLKHNLTLDDLARRIGSRNVSKAAKKICRFEHEGVVRGELLASLADALGIDLPKVEELLEKDRQEYLREWEAWVSEPVPMQLIARVMPGVHAKVPLPPEIITPEQAEAFACQYAKKHAWKVCLVLSRKDSVWISEEGDVEFSREATPV